MAWLQRRLLHLLGVMGGNGTLQKGYPMIPWVEERKINLSADGKSDKSEVKLYYDNTYGMQGFVQDENNSTISNGNTAVNGTLVRLVHALQETVDRQQGKYYILQKDSKQEFVWQEYTEDLADTFGGADFYTHKGSLPKKPTSENVEIGPLTQLYYEGMLDYSALNLVVTDLAEQNVKNYALANEINQHILSQEGYAVALVAVKCDFNSSVRAPDIDRVSGMDKQKYNGKRPLLVKQRHKKNQRNRYARKRASFQNCLVASEK